MANKTSTYDSSLDRVLGPVQILHFDASTGEPVSGFGEGVLSLALCVRQNMNAASAEEGAAEPGPRIAICTAFVQKARREGGKGMVRWIVGAQGKCTSGVPSEGQVALGAQIGRLSPALAAAVFPAAGQYAARVSAKLASRKAA